MLPPHFKDLLNLSYGLGNLRNIYYLADIDILIGDLLELNQIYMYYVTVRLEHIKEKKKNLW